MIFVFIEYHITINIEGNFSLILEMSKFPFFVKKISFALIEEIKEKRRLNKKRLKIFTKIFHKTLIKIFMYVNFRHNQNEIIFLLILRKTEI